MTSKWNVAILVASLFMTPLLSAAEPLAAPQENPAPAVVTWPDTFAAQRAKAFIEAAYAETDEPMRQFQSAYRSPESLKETPLEARVAKGRSLLEQAGQLEIAKVEPQGEYVVDVTARSTKLDLWLKFHFEFGSDAPHYIVTIQGVPTTPPNVSIPKVEKWSNLKDLVEQVHKSSNLPAMAVAVIHNGSIEDYAVVGTRRTDRPDPVQRDDLFHIGSIGKSMTATLIAKLIEDGVLRWDMTLGAALADVEMKSEYRSVTLEQLLQHRGGIRPYVDDVTEDAAPSVKSKTSPLEQRAAFAAQVLNESPVLAPGTAMIYSNAGYSLAAHIAERAAKKPWEQLLQELVFKNLELSLCGIGWPATRDRPDQPYGHFDSPPNLRVQGFDEYNLGFFLSPAGDIHCSIEHLARYASFHLQGLQGRDGWLKADTVRRLHAPGGGDRDGYACGWVIEEIAGRPKRHWHDGSAGTFYAGIVLFPEKNLAIVTAANAGPVAKAYLERIVDAVYRRATGADKTTPPTK